MAIESTFVGLLLLLSATNGLFFADLKQILLFPTVAFRVPPSGSTTDWLLYEQGWFYEEDPLQAKIMEKLIEPIVQRNILFDRLKMFTADGIKDQTVCIDGLSSPLCTTTTDKGQIKNTFRVLDSDMQRLPRTSGPSGGKLTFQVSNQRYNLRATGEIFPCDDNGVTFITDIDDTIKYNGESSTVDTIVHTFTESFRAIEGMAQKYQQWQQRYDASFAYVTAAPDQMFPFLRPFMDANSFPQGSMHMRHFTWFDKNFLTFFTSKSHIDHKMEALNLFLQNTQYRKFVLIGDIFEDDPEIYANVTTKYPNRIRHIFIRKRADDTTGQQRLEQVFANANYPREQWGTFETGDQLPLELSYI